MDNIRFGSFVAQLRKERGLTQKELAQRLHVTDKAVSKWETGRGFSDLKLLEPLAQTLEVSLVELLQGERTSSPTLSVEEAGQVAGPTVIITSSAPLFPAWFRPALLALLCAACGVLVFRLHCLERRLK